MHDPGAGSGLHADDPTGRMSDDLLTIWQDIDRCATVTTDAILAADPRLDRKGIYKALSQEIWAAVADITRLARSGAVLS